MCFCLYFVIFYDKRTIYFFPTVHSCSKCRPKKPGVEPGSAVNGFGFAEHQSIAGDLGVVAIGYFPTDLKMFSFLIIIFALIHCCFL